VGAPGQLIPVRTALDLERLGDDAAMTETSDPRELPHRSHFVKRDDGEKVMEVHSVVLDRYVGNGWTEVADAKGTPVKAGAPKPAPVLGGKA
jgi:hypothetical protein